MELSLSILIGHPQLHFFNHANLACPPIVTSGRPTRGWHFFMSILIDPPQLHLVGFHMSIPRRSPRIVNQASTTLRQCWPNPFGAEREGCSLQYYHSALYNICRCVSFFVCLYSSLCLCLALCLLNFNFEIRRGACTTPEKLPTMQLKEHKANQAAL